MQSPGSALFFILLLLVGATGAVLVIENRKPPHQHRAESFQHLVGGLGFGPALDLSGCAFAFDPRLDASCQEDLGPIPGGSWFCPRHAGSVFFYPPLKHAVEMPLVEDGDALPR